MGQFKAWGLCLGSGQGLPSVCKCQCSYSPFLGAGLSKGEPFHTGWKKSCRTKSGIHGNGGNAKRWWQEGNFTKLLEQFDSQDCVPRDSQCGYANVVMLKKCLPTFLRPHGVPGPLMPTLRGRQAQGWLLTPCECAHMSEILSQEVWCLYQSIEMWGGSQPAKTGTPTPADSLVISQENPGCFLQQPEVFGKNLGLGVQAPYSSFLLGK